MNEPCLSDAEISCERPVVFKPARFALAKLP
jgi:hypothetical protein